MVPASLRPLPNREMKSAPRMIRYLRCRNGESMRRLSKRRNTAPPPAKFWLFAAPEADEVEFGSYRW